MCFSITIAVAFGRLLIVDILERNAQAESLSRFLLSHNAVGGLILGEGRTFHSNLQSQNNGPTPNMLIFPPLFPFLLASMTESHATIQCDFSNPSMASSAKDACVSLSMRHYPKAINMNSGVILVSMFAILKMNASHPTGVMSHLSDHDAFSLSLGHFLVSRFEVLRMRASNRNAFSTVRVPHSTYLISKHLSIFITCLILREL